MSFTIGNNLAAKQVTPAGVQAKPFEKSEEPPPAVRDLGPSQIPSSNESASVFTALFAPTSEGITNENATLVEAEEGLINEDFWMEWTDDVPEMKHAFEEVEVSTNEKVDSTDTDNSEEHDEEKDPNESYLPNELVTEEDADSLCLTN